jgi:hypothetical protein
VEEPRANPKSSEKDKLWYFVGKVDGRDVELLCTTYDNNVGCHEVAHKYFDNWIPTLHTSGAKYLSYVDMDGDWQEVIIPSQFIQEQIKVDVKDVKDS